MVVPFPFTKSAGFKNRPVLVLASWPYNASEHYLVCAVTTQSVPTPGIIEVEAGDIEGGTLNKRCYIRPTYLFTADEALITKRVGTLKTEKLLAVLTTVHTLTNPII